MTTKILGISGSLRAGSYNTALLRAAQTAGGEGVHIEVATLHGIPLYDGDVEVRDGVPASVVALKEKIVACDGVLLVTPEYNNSIPGVFKNAIDWLSRPPSDIGRVFKNRAVAVDRSVARRLRYDSVAECLVAGVAHARRAVLGGRTADGFTSATGVRREGQPEGRFGTRSTREVRYWICCVRDGTAAGNSAGDRVLRAPAAHGLTARVGRHAWLPCITRCFATPPRCH